MNKLILCALLWLPLSVTAIEVDLLRLQQQLHSSPVLRGDFQQSKAVSGFNRALLSNGHFVLARNRGILWDTAQPFPNQMSIGPAGLRLAGEAAIVSSGGDQRVLALMLALLSLDTDRLKRDFELHLNWQESNWTLALKPRSAELSNLLSGVRLQGAAQIEQVEFSDAEGNHTAIRFSALRSEPIELNAEEAQRFD